MKKTWGLIFVVTVATSGLANLVFAKTPVNNLRPESSDKEQLSTSNNFTKADFSSARVLMNPSTPDKSSFRSQTEYLGSRQLAQLKSIALNLEELEREIQRSPALERATKVDKRASSRLKRTSTDQASANANRPPTVPFFSQLTDIASPYWQKVGCGIASTAMIIEYYRPGRAEVETLLKQGINDGSFLTEAGWIHSGLIKLTKPFGLDGESHSLAHLSMSEAFSTLEAVLSKGPVMASVHYTFEPTNPIPHLVVITGVKGGLVYYNDPAETAGGGAITLEKFQSAWKKRYIEIRPVS